MGSHQETHEEEKAGRVNRTKFDTLLGETEEEDNVEVEAKTVDSINKSIEKPVVSHVTKITDPLNLANHNNTIAIAWLSETNESIRKIRQLIFEIIFQQENCRSSSMESRQKSSTWRKGFIKVNRRRSHPSSLFLQRRGRG